MNTSQHPFHFFAYEGYKYTVVNPSSVEALPGIAIEDPETNLTCKDMRKAIWALAKVPEMAYMLKRHSVESAFMSRLDCETENLPIVKHKQGYVLREDVRTSWQRLEAIFVPITSILMDTQRRSPEGNISWMTHWSLPSEFEYLKVHRTGLSARIAAARSRDACVLLLARCSMAIALCDHPGNGPPHWLRPLQGRVPSAWIDILQQSVVADFSPGLRAGAYIDLTGKTAWVHHVPCMIRANLPVYICWNEDRKKIASMYPFLVQYMPPITEITQVEAESPSRLQFRWPIEETHREASEPTYVLGENGACFVQSSCWN